MKNLEKKVKLLTGYAIGSSILMSGLMMFSFKAQREIENFDEINVKRINVIENDGTLRMVISNKASQHSGRMDGRDYAKRDRPAGMIFFNDEGDECGDLSTKRKKPQMARSAAECPLPWTATVTIRPCKS